MNWSEAAAHFTKKHGRVMTSREWDAFLGHNDWNFSIAGLWSYRGAIWAKYEGSYPEPKDVGLVPNHSFFEPDYVDYFVTRRYGGELVREEWRHHGRKMRPNHRLWATRPQES